MNKYVTQTRPCSDGHTDVKSSYTRLKITIIADVLLSKKIMAEFCLHKSLISSLGKFHSTSAMIKNEATITAIFYCNVVCIGDYSHTAIRISYLDYSPFVQSQSDFR